MPQEESGLRLSYGSESAPAAAAEFDFRGSGARSRPAALRPQRCPASPAPALFAGVRRGESMVTALSSNSQFSRCGWRGSIMPRPTISLSSSSERPVWRQNSVIVNVTVILAIRLSPCLTRLEAGLCIRQLLPELTALLIWFWRHDDFDHRYRSPVVVLLVSPLPFTAAADRPGCPAEWSAGCSLSASG